MLASRSSAETLWKIGLFSNKPLLAAVCGTLLLQATVIYVPVLQIVFNTVPLSIQDVAIVFGLSGTVFVAVELVKQARSRSPQLSH